MSKIYLKNRTKRNRRIKKIDVKNEEKIDKKNEKKIDIFLSQIKKNSPSVISTLFSGLLVSVTLYLAVKDDNENSWCTKEIKSFNINDYRKKDLDILIDKCSSQLVEYQLFEDILFNSNDIDKFSSITNQLYVDKKIDDSFIIDFSDKLLIKNLKNPMYNFDNTYVNTSNNLPILEKQINKYLLFTKEIIFKTYTKEQESNLFNIMTKLFINNEIFTNNFNSHNIYSLDNKSIDPKVNENFLNLIKISNNMGKKNDMVFRTESKKILDLTLIDLFNSYKNNRNESHKKILIKKLSVLSQLIKDKRSLKNDTQNNKNVNYIFYSQNIIKLILLQLNNYNLTEAELRNIFNTYILSFKYEYSFNMSTNIKLIFNLFSENYNFNRVDQSQIFTELFLPHFMANLKEDRGMINNANLINYFAIKEQVPWLLSLINRDESGNRIIKKGDNSNINLSIDDEKYKRLERNIFDGIIISMKYNGYKVDYKNILINIISSEKDDELKRDLIMDSLVLDDVKIVEFVIEYININIEDYSKKLNNEQYSSLEFNNSTIVARLFNNKTSSILLSDTIKKKKIDLLIKLIKKVKNDNNRLKIFDNAIKILEKKDIFLINTLKHAILEENNSRLRREMLNKLLIIEKN